jgi:hypothetical protein
MVKRMAEKTSSAQQATADAAGPMRDTWAQAAPAEGSGQSFGVPTAPEYPPAARRTFLDRLRTPVAAALSGVVILGAGFGAGYVVGKDHASSTSIGPEQSQNGQEQGGFGRPGFGPPGTLPQDQSQQGTTSTTTLSA